ncbi:hypothetical protein RA263_27475, partial [Pseudomonas syringae pv. tagetis]
FFFFFFVLVLLVLFCLVLVGWVCCVFVCGGCWGFCGGLFFCGCGLCVVVFVLLLGVFLVVLFGVGVFLCGLFWVGGVGGFCVWVVVGVVGGVVGWFFVFGVFCLLCCGGRWCWWCLGLWWFFLCFLFFWWFCVLFIVVLCVFVLGVGLLGFFCCWGVWLVVWFLGVVLGLFVLLRLVGGGVVWFV